MSEHNRDKRLARCSLNGSPKVALEHYARVIESDLQEADKMSLLSEVEKAAQKPVQHDAAKSRKASQTALNEYQESAFLLLNAALCSSVHECRIPPRGVELPSIKPQKSAKSLNLGKTAQNPTHATRRKHQKTLIWT